jgi:hypothetical protein
MKDLWISVATHGTAGGLEDGHRRVGQSSEVVERMEAMNDDQAELEEFGKRWAEAELARDLTLLDAAVVVGFLIRRLHTAVDPTTVSSVPRRFWCGTTASGASSACM